MHPSVNHRITRRSFLGKTGAAAAALGFPAWIPSSARGADGHTAPSERLNMAFIGLGGQGRGHFAGGGWTYSEGGYLARPEVQVRAVCDVVRDRRDEAAAHANQRYAERLGRADYRDVTAYNDFREILARPDIDAVVLSLPYQWAAPMSLMAMRQGKDVYCEKPVAITVQESRELVATARRFGAIYQAGTQQRSAYGGNFRRACELVRNGYLGELKEVYAWVPPGAYLAPKWNPGTGKPVPEGVDWDLWLGPLPWRAFDQIPCQQLPGCYHGDINWGPHHYDFVSWVLDPPPDQPVEIEVTGKVVRYHFANGVVVHSTPYPGEKVGAEGGAVFVGSAGRLAVDRSALVTDPKPLARVQLKSGDRRVYHSTNHADNFLECIRSRRPPICCPEEAARSIQMLLSGGIALGLNRSLRWDPAALRFTNDDDANRYLSYRPRAPWHI